MPYELTTVANRQDPSDKPGRAERQTPTLSKLFLTGDLDSHASEAILATLAQTCVEGADSVVVEFDDVVASDARALDQLVAGLMSLRARGIEVQVFAREDALYEQLLALPQSRDWLLWRPADGAELPRKSLHVDGSTGPKL